MTERFSQPLSARTENAGVCDLWQKDALRGQFMRTCIALALVLTLLVSGASAENPYVSDWVTTYNGDAQAQGLDSLDAARFEYDADEGVYALMLDENTVLMLGLNEGDLYVCGLQALKDDQRSAPMMACALAATAENLSYEQTLALFTKLLEDVAKKGGTAYEEKNSWYLMAAVHTDEEGTYLAVAFYSVTAFLNLNGEETPDEDQPGNIWEGLEPDGDSPAPTDTPKLTEGHYKI